MKEIGKTSGGLNNTFTKRPRLTQQDLPYAGTGVENDTAVLQDGWYSVNIDRHSIHVHDGVTKGGHEIPNLNTVRRLIASGVDSSIFVGTLLQVLAATSVTTGDLGVASDTGGLLVKVAGGLWSGHLGVLTTLPDNTSVLADGVRVERSVAATSVAYVLNSGTWTPTGSLIFDTLASLVSALTSDTTLRGVPATVSSLPSSLLTLGSDDLLRGSLGYGTWSTKDDIPSGPYGPGTLAYLVDGTLCQFGGT